MHGSLAEAEHRVVEAEACAGEMQRAVCDAYTACAREVIAAARARGDAASNLHLAVSNGRNADRWKARAEIAEGSVEQIAGPKGELAESKARIASLEVELAHEKKEHGVSVRLFADYTDRAAALLEGVEEGKKTGFNVGRALDALERLIKEANACQEWELKKKVALLEAEVANRREDERALASVIQGARVALVRGREAQRKGDLTGLVECVRLALQTLPSEDGPDVGAEPESEGNGLPCPVPWALRPGETKSVPTSHTVVTPVGNVSAVTP